MLANRAIYDVGYRSLVKVILHDFTAMLAIETGNGVEYRLVRFDELMQRELLARRVLMM